MKISMKGMEIHVLEPGENHGEKEPSLLFLHGAGGEAAVWESQAAYFRGLHPVYRVELPGHGLSSGDGEDDIAAYAEWVHGIIKKGLPSHEWVIVGHSMGGAIALQLALEYPSFAIGLILVGTGAKLRVLPIILKMLERDPESFFKLIDLAAFCSSTPPEVRRIASESMRRCAPKVILKDFTACDHFDVRSRLREITLPCLIACGENDKLTPLKYSQYLRQNLSSGRLLLIPDAGHMVMIENPEPLNEAIKAFLDEISASDRRSH